MTRLIRKVTFLAAALLAAMGCLLETGRLEAAGPKLNVLFIAVDDLRPELSVYGRKVISPNPSTSTLPLSLDSKHHPVRVDGSMPSTLTRLLG